METQVDSKFIDTIPRPFRLPEERYAPQTILPDPEVRIPVTFEADKSALQPLAEFLDREMSTISTWEGVQVLVNGEWQTHGHGVGKDRAVRVGVQECMDRYFSGDKGQYKKISDTAYEFTVSPTDPDYITLPKIIVSTVSVATIEAQNEQIRQEKIVKETQTKQIEAEKTIQSEQNRQQQEREQLYLESASILTEFFSNPTKYVQTELDTFLAETFAFPQDEEFSWDQDEIEAHLVEVLDATTEAETKTSESLSGLTKKKLARFLDIDEADFDRFVVEEDAFDEIIQVFQGEKLEKDGISYIQEKVKNHLDSLRQQLIDTVLLPGISEAEIEEFYDTYPDVLQKRTPIMKKRFLGRLEPTGEFEVANRQELALTLAETIKETVVQKSPVTVDQLIQLIEDMPKKYEDRMDECKTYEIVTALQQDVQFLVEADQNDPLVWFKIKNKIPDTKPSTLLPFFEAGWFGNQKRESLQTRINTLLEQAEDEESKQRLEDILQRFSLDNREEQEQALKAYIRKTKITSVTPEQLKKMLEKRGVRKLTAEDAPTAATIAKEIQQAYVPDFSIEQLDLILRDTLIGNLDQPTIDLGGVLDRESVDYFPKNLYDDVMSLLAKRAEEVQDIDGIIDTFASDHFTSDTQAEKDILDDGEVEVLVREVNHALQN